MRISVFIACSLDGFIARSDDRLDWLTSFPPDEEAGDYGYAAFFDTIDCLILGRRTFDTVLGFPEWPYGGTRVVVPSATLAALPPEAADRAELTRETPRELVARLEREGHRRAYLDGGATIRSFLRDGLVDDMIITRMPLLLGDGIPLFGGTGGMPLRHVRTRAWANGVVQSEYTIPPARSGTSDPIV